MRLTHGQLNDLGLERQVHWLQIRRRRKLIHHRSVFRDIVHVRYAKQNETETNSPAHLFSMSLLLDPKSLPSSTQLESVMNSTKSGTISTNTLASGLRSGSFCNKSLTSFLRFDE